mmetsp:Transcript_23477/g.55994  ORF Transcript_23477/g.55994 Transcript_23477/m.55994 type:complete len:495 (-) Transcript_23477:139-1623(-)
MSDVSFVTELKQGMEAKFETAVFDAADLQQNYGIDATQCVWLEIASRDRLYGLFVDYLGSTCNTTKNLSSFTPVQDVKKQSLSDRIFGVESSSIVRTSFGLGVAHFEHSVSGKAYKIHAVHQRRGPVVGTNCGAVMYQNLILLVEGKENKFALTDLCESLLKNDETADLNEFTIFRWHVQNNFWQRKGRKVARTVDSVVLPAETKDKIITDLDQFLTRDTYKWYAEHGIPYKRSFLFYGVPGAGKTSLLQALAGKYRRNLCILQPTDPRFTDDKLADAIKDAPARSIIVLEDVDALFDKGRGSCNAKIQITFSGLLNALDGICNPDGQIFILTTNFREHLDAALIRNGRVDLHIEFTHAQPAQMRQLFLQFYPGEEALADKFREKLMGALGEKKVSMAALQHFFIGKRTKSATEACDDVAQVLVDLAEKDAEAKSQEDQGTPAAAAAAAATAAAAAAQKKQKKKSGKGGGGAVHVHIHTKNGGNVTEEDEEDEE